MKDYKVLCKCTYDENAVRLYDIFRGGFIWSDEIPGGNQSHFIGVAYGMLAGIIAYRASLTAGKPRTEFETEWNALKTACPTWPGFREERIHGQIERDFRAVKLREDRALRRAAYPDDNGD